MKTWPCMICGEPIRQDRRESVPLGSEFYQHVDGFGMRDHFAVRPPSPEPTEPVHWRGESPTSLHGNGAASFARTSTDTADVTCKLCLTLLARFDGLAARFGLGAQPSDPS